MDISKLVRPETARLFKYEPGEDRDDHVKLSSNENPRPPHPHVVEAILRAANSSNRYPPSGSPALSEALAKRHGLASAEIMVGNGSNEIIDLLVRAFVAPGENVVYPVPSFIVYALIPAICGVEAIPVDCRDYRLDLVAMRAAITDKTRMVFICNPNNPTSTYVTASEVDAFLDGLREDILVIMDEAYIEYVDAPDYPDSLALRRKRNTIVALRTFSKFYAMAGIRLGYAIADPVVIDTLHRVRQPFNVSLIAQAAGLAAVEVADELQSGRAETIAERARVRAGLLDLGITCPPSQSNFVFADLGDSDLDLHEALSADGVIIRRMGQFGASRNSYRISVGTPQENDALLGALRGVMDRNST